MKKGFTEDGKFGKGNRVGRGRPPARDVSRWRREAQAEFRKWVQYYSSGQGIKALTPEIVTLLRAARACYMRLLELGVKENLSDNQMKLTVQLSNSLSRLLNQVGRQYEVEEEDQEDKRIY